MINPFKKHEDKPLEEMTPEERASFYSRNRNRKVEAKILMPTDEEIKKEQVGL